ncbi:MAG: hypothetical protein KI788_15795 [Mameliella sp.]|nr:hypothetical protein [Mameliella sp.]
MIVEWIAPLVIGFIAGWLAGLFRGAPGRHQTSRVCGNGHVVVQSGCTATGDIVGGDKVGGGNEKPCPYCGGH